MNRSVIVYGLMLIAALTGAYWSWNHEPATTESRSVEIARFPAQSVESFTWETDEKKVEVSLESDETGRYAWVTHTRRAIASKPENAARDDRAGASGPEATGHDAADDAAGSASTDADAGSSSSDSGVGSLDAANGAPSTGTAETSSVDAGRGGNAADGPDRGSNAPEREDGSTESKVKTYKASSALDRFLEDLDPLTAVRRLSARREKAEKLYGFDEPLGTLTIRTSEKTRVFTVGGYAYGRQHMYLRDERDGSYYVVGAGVISPLKFADTRLREQRVLGRTEREMKRIVVQSDGRSATLVQHNIDDPRASFWSIGTDSDEESRTANSWVGKLSRVEIAEYRSAQRPGDTRLAAVVEVVPRDGAETYIRFFETEGSGAKTRFFAISDFTRKFVELRTSSASSLLADLDTLFDPGERPEEAKGGDRDVPPSGEMPPEKRVPAPRPGDERPRK